MLVLSNYLCRLDTQNRIEEEIFRIQVDTKWNGENVVKERKLSTTNKPICLYREFFIFISMLVWIRYVYVVHMFKRKIISYVYVGQIFFRVELHAAKNGMKRQYAYITK